MNEPSESTLDLKSGTDFGTSAPTASCNDRVCGDHFVQFYESDDFLINSLNEFIGAGLGKGDSAIVIATEQHRLSLESQLRDNGLNVEGLKQRGQFISLDAAEVLSQFMVSGSPDPQLFNRVIGKVLCGAEAAGKSVRAFGEMVALLWADGRGAQAIQLEEFWNEIGRKHRFTLFCAYPMGGFSEESHGPLFNHICKTHSHVIPAETYTGHANDDDRLRAISYLQQRACALEAEVQERKACQEALEHRETELRDFLETATEGIHRVGPDGRILWANQSELDLLGYAKEEYIGHHISEFYPDEKVIDDILSRLKRGEKLHDYEARMRRRDGSIRYVSINSSVYWEGDRFLYTRCFTRDITDRKKAAELLEQTVEERTAQLQETVADLEAFSYSVSHDLRSPLRAMQGHARALLLDHAHKLEPTAVDSLQRIQRAANRLDLLVRDILTYSTVAKSQIALKPIDLEPLLDDLIKNQLEHLGGAECVTVVHPLPLVLGHEGYLTQCLTNLIENGLKFVPDGRRPSVRIHSEIRGNQVRLWVSDNGIGIHPEHHDRIFKMFGRVHPQNKYPGTGIGLAIVKKAVARMNGQVGFDSTPSAGTNFWIDLPLCL
ncbi:MAG TPA: ATP-binding protein [Candidatus Saccharimonadales bacterium]|nr:ATP-binding protein [Candidatus Saccharimonadales bacterium]